MPLFCFLFLEFFFPSPSLPFLILLDVCRSIIPLLRDTYTCAFFFSLIFYLLFLMLVPVQHRPDRTDRQRGIDVQCSTVQYSAVQYLHLPT